MEAALKEQEEQLTKNVKQSSQHLRTAEYYYAYDFVYSYVSQPFSIKENEMLFHCAQYLMSAMTEASEVPSEVNKVTVLLALSKLAPQLNMMRLARQVHERLQQFVIPPQLADYLDVVTLQMRGKPFHDRDDLLISCPRCGQTCPSLPTVSAGGDRCSNCHLPFVRCWASFVVLPLVEFVLDPSLGDAEAEAILSGLSSVATQDQIKDSNNPNAKTTTTTSYNKDLRGKQTQGANADVITFTNDDYIDAAIGKDGGNDEDESSSFNSAHQDPFSRQLLHMQLTRNTELTGAGSSSFSNSKKQNRYQPIVVNGKQLRKLARDDVFIAHRGYGLPNSYYRNMQPTRANITICYSCNKFFKVEEFEFACMKRSGACPFCRVRRDEAQQLLKQKKKKVKLSNK